MNAEPDVLGYEDLVRAAAAHVPACIRALADEVENNKGAPRISAANSLMEWAFGKPRQAVDLSGEAAITIHITRFSEEQNNG